MTWKQGLASKPDTSNAARHNLQEGTHELQLDGVNCYVTTGQEAIFAAKVLMTHTLTQALVYLAPLFA
eukprot:scaffold373731_cov23-Prasinocladus_malaysianus.AAC.1